MFARQVGMRTTYSSEEEEQRNGRKRTSRLVDVGEDLGSVPSLGEGAENTGSGVDAGETDGEDSDADSGVDNVRKNLDTGSFDHDDEGRGGGSVGATGEPGVVEGKVDTDDGERGDVLLQRKRGR